MKKITILFLSALLLVGCSVNTEMISNSSNTTIDASYSESNASTIELGDETKISGAGLSLKDDVVTISTPGTYIITGNSDTAEVKVDTESTGTIKLVLIDVTLTSTSGPAIHIVSADETYIILADDTTSTITVSGENDDEEKSAIFSKDDLVIAGSGTLIVNSENDGIKANDNLTIQDTTITLNVEDDGLNVNDELMIVNANITITSGGDSIKAGNDNAENAGSVTVNNSSLTFTSDDEGIDATGDVTILDSTIDITTGDGYENSRHTSSSFEAIPSNMQNNFNMNDQPSDMNGDFENITPPDGNTPPNDMNKENGEVPSDFDKNSTPPTNDNFENTTEFTSTGDDESEEENTDDEESLAKGIKTDTLVTISNSNITINSSDDAIHSNGEVIVESGTLFIQSGDDAIHADNALTINGGTITIDNCYEGLESKTITINDGTINITATDDGINSTDSSSTSSFMQGDDSMLYIHGGTITITADGDGIDMNGNGEMDGGTLTIYGPTSNADGAIDFDGTFNVNDGTLLAGGSSGMAQTPSSSSTAYTIMMNTSGGLIEIKDSSGNVIFTYESTRSYNNLVIASESLKQNETYTIYEDGEEIETVTITEQITNISSSSSNDFSGMPQGNERPKN